LKTQHHVHSLCKSSPHPQGNQMTSLSQALNLFQHHQNMTDSTKKQNSNHDTNCFLMNK
jgi:hypothetical protein